MACLFSLAKCVQVEEKGVNDIEAEDLWRRNLEMAARLHSDVSGIHDDVCGALYHLALFLQRKTLLLNPETESLFWRQLSIAEQLLSYDDSIASARANLAAVLQGKAWHAKAAKI